MISVATLDPSTLALWFDPTYVTSAETAEICDTTLRLNLGRGLNEYRAFYSSLNQEHRSFSANIASAIWHEKRHFLDLILTNYGAYRVRQFFMVACNAKPLLDKVGDRIAFPLHVYTDPVRRRLAGISTPDPSIEKFAREIAFRQELFRLEGRSINIQGVMCELGGDAQLEALAYTFQVGANQRWLGIEGAKQWHFGLGENVTNTRYRWAEVVANECGLLPRKSAAGLEVVDFTLLIAVLYASLMMRSWGQGYAHPSLGEIGILPPYARLRMLLDDLRGTGMAVASLSVSDAWELVNNRCEKLFGRSAIAEAEADHALEGEWVKKLASNDPAAIAFGDFHSLRGRFIDLLKSDPEQILGIERCSSALLPELEPLSILANPSGIDGDPPVGMESLLEQRTPSGAKWWWAALLQRPKSDYSFKEVDSWAVVLKYFAPLAKLIISGRRHQLMIGPELLLMERQLERMGRTISFDKPFEFPTEQDDTSDFYRLSARKNFKCDFCATVIPRGEGRLIGPWTIRRNQRLAQACVGGLGGGETGLQRFWKDWSQWHMCSKCISDFREIGISV